MFWQKKYKRDQPQNFRTNKPYESEFSIIRWPLLLIYPICLHGLNKWERCAINASYGCYVPNGRQWTRKQTTASWFWFGWPIWKVDIILILRNGGRQTAATSLKLDCAWGCLDSHQTHSSWGLINRSLFYSSYNFDCSTTRFGFSIDCFKWVLPSTKIWD